MIELLLELLMFAALTVSAALFLGAVRVYRNTQRAYQRIRAQANRIMAHYDSPRCEYLFTRFAPDGWPVWTRLDITTDIHHDEPTGAISVRTARTTAIRCGLHQNHTGSGHMITPGDMRKAGYTLPPF